MFTSNGFNNSANQKVEIVLLPYNGIGKPIFKRFSTIEESREYIGLNMQFSDFPRIITRIRISDNDKSKIQSSTNNENSIYRQINNSIRTDTKGSFIDFNKLTSYFISNGFLKETADLTYEINKATQLNV